MRDIGTEQLPAISDDRDPRPTHAHASGHAEGPLGAIREDDSPVPPVSRGRGGLWLGLIVVAIVAVLIYAGIHSRHKNEDALKTSTDAGATPVVMVTHPSAGATDAAEVVLPANVTAFVDTPIYARTSGYLRHWYFDIGTRVQKGALLAVIETPELDQQVSQAEADVKTAESNLQIAQTTSARWQKLLQKNAVSRQEADQNESNVTAAQSALSAQQANLKRTQQLQNFERVYAPFSGVITARNVDTGSLIEAGQNTTQKELFHLAASDRLRVFVPVPEVYQSAVHDGARVPITLDAFPNEHFYGTLARTSRAVDPLSRTLNVEVDVDNTTGKLLPGAYAFVHFALPAELQALRVPANTLLFRSKGMQVGVVENGRVSLRSVKIGHDFGATVEITEGLKATDEIVVDPSDSLESGDMVRVDSPRVTGSTAESSNAGDKKAAQ
ncbi:efflux RND transporter periplasmic adaptor subunit [Acidipila sp. EB88]|nr:efflux RND transporter periplasmic adaptor subunit [Acidipila sp. EB88]